MMLLKALVEYYDRLPEEKCLPPYGLERVSIDWILYITPLGEFFALHPQITSKKEQAPIHEVSTRPVTTSGVGSPYFWGKKEYVLGIGNNGEKKNADFINTVNKIVSFYPDDLDFTAVKKFYENPDNLQKARQAYASEIQSKPFLKTDKFIAFSIYKTGGHSPLVAEDKKLIIYRRYSDELEKSD